MAEESKKSDLRSDSADEIVDSPSERQDELAELRDKLEAKEKEVGGELRALSQTSCRGGQF